MGKNVKCDHRVQSTSWSLAIDLDRYFKTPQTLDEIASFASKKDFRSGIVVDLVLTWRRWGHT